LLTPLAHSPYNAGKTGNKKEVVAGKIILQRFDE